MTPFPATERKAFNGLCLVIVRSKVGESGKIKVNIISDELEKTTVYIICK
jgi:beta-galactosidase